VLTLWVRGANPDGSLPEGEGQEQFVENLRELTSWFTDDELVTLRYTVNGDAREIIGEVITSIEPKPDGYGRYRSATVKIALNCAQPFWADVEPRVQTVTLAADEEATLTEFAGATAPMEDLLVVFAQQSNPRLMQESTSVFVALDRVVTSGQTITVCGCSPSCTASAGRCGGNVTQCRGWSRRYGTSWPATRARATARRRRRRAWRRGRRSARRRSCSATRRSATSRRPTRTSIQAA
jgi:hypothetical protein